jgi:hypothetical protein
MPLGPSICEFGALQGCEGPTPDFRSLQRISYQGYEIEAAILPVSLRAEKLCYQYAIRVLSFAKDYPVRKAIQRQQQLQISTQLRELAERVQEQSDVKEISILLAKPWSKPASAYATFHISTSDKSETAKLHKQWLRGLRDKAKASILL